MNKTEPIFKVGEQLRSNITKDTVTIVYVGKENYVVETSDGQEFIMLIRDAQEFYSVKKKEAVVTKDQLIEAWESAFFQVWGHARGAVDSAVFEGMCKRLGL